jgi:Meiotically up-regulated gene 113
MIVQSRITHIYVMAYDCNSAPSKIGISRNVNQRLAELNAASPKQIILCWHEPILGKATELEKRCHRSLKKQRLNGEWFEVTPEEAIEIIKRNGDRKGKLLNAFNFEENCIYTVAEFYRNTGQSEADYFERRKLGFHPAELHFGKKILILGQDANVFLESLYEKKVA